MKMQHQKERKSTVSMFLYVSYKGTLQMNYAEHRETITNIIS